jgi:hypothetical protein
MCYGSLRFVTVTTKDHFCPESGEMHGFVQIV